MEKWKQHDLVFAMITAHESRVEMSQVPATWQWKSQVSVGGRKKKGSILAVEQIFELRIQIFCTCTSLVNL